MNVRQAIDPSNDVGDYSQTKSAFESAAANTKSAFDSAAATTSAKLKNVLSNSKSKLDNALDHAIDAASDGYEKAEEITIRKVREQPFMAAGVALGAGLILGMLIAGARRH